MSKVLKKDFNQSWVGRNIKSGRSAAAREQKRQGVKIARQQQKEAGALAEATSEVAEREARMRKKSMGRGSLMASSAASSTGTGTGSTLGGS